MDGHMMHLNKQRKKDLTKVRPKNFRSLFLFLKHQVSIDFATNLSSLSLVSVCFIEFSLRSDFYAARIHEDE